MRTNLVWSLLLGVTFCLPGSTISVEDRLATKERFADESGSKPEVTQVDYRRFLRWHRYSYEIKSNYPFVNQLPPWKEIPTLLDWVVSDRSDPGVGIAASQLIAISRVEFGNSQLRVVKLTDRLQIWMKAREIALFKKWWKTVGKGYDDRLKSHGRKNRDAWKLVTRDNPQPLPEYLITIPDEWVVQARFHSGDYMGVYTESLTLRRTAEAATLIRQLRRTTGGPLEWQRWQSLTLKQADDFAFAVAYAIDNPWLLKPKDPEAIKKNVLEGRSFVPYYPDFKWHFADGHGNMWWNDDPWSWYGGKEVEENFMEGVGFCTGSVCMLLCRTFPDSTNRPNGNAPGWVTVKMPDKGVLKEVVDYLDMQEELADPSADLWQAMDALEALTKFGKPDHLPAIRRLESQCRVSVPEWNSVLQGDPNKEFYLFFLTNLLVEAQTATSEIQKRATERK